MMKGEFENQKLNEAQPLSSVTDAELLTSAPFFINTLLSAGDFNDALKCLMIVNFGGFIQSVSICPIKFDDIETELKSYKELCRVYAKECGRLQNIIHSIPPEIVALYKIVHLP